MSEKDDLLKFLVKMQDSADYLRIKALKDRHCYKIYARNAYVGVWVKSQKSFIISRYKVGSTPCLFSEYHWDIGEPLGTVKPIELIELFPFRIRNRYSDKEEKEILAYLDELEEKHPLIKGCNTLQERKLAAMQFEKRLSAVSTRAKVVHRVFAKQSLSNYKGGVNIMDTEYIIHELSKAGLTSKYGEVPGKTQWIKIWARDNFCCAYCGANLLNDVISMSSAQIDHVLPKSKYKDYKDEDSNMVLACYCCNQIKRAFDPLEKLPEHERILITVETIGSFREKLLSICRDYVIRRLEQKKEILNRSNEVLGTMHALNLCTKNQEEP